MLQTLYTSLIHCSYLDYQYACVVWCPFQLGGMRAIEKIQRCATKIVPSLKDKSYYDRLISLNLPGWVLYKVQLIMQGYKISRIVKNYCKHLSWKL